MLKQKINRILSPSKSVAGVAVEKPSMIRIPDPGKRIKHTQKRLKKREVQAESSNSLEGKSNKN